MILAMLVAFGEMQRVHVYRGCFMLEDGISFPGRSLAAGLASLLPCEDKATPCMYVSLSPSDSMLWFWFDRPRWSGVRDPGYLCAISELICGKLFSRVLETSAPSEGLTCLLHPDNTIDSLLASAITSRKLSA